MKRMLQKEFYLLVLMFALLGILPLSVMAEESATENSRLLAIETVNKNEIGTKQASNNIEYVSEFQDGFTVNSLTANRVGEQIIFTVDYYSNRDCDYSLFDPPNGDVIMKAVYGGIKSGSNSAELALSLYDLKRMMANPDITMKFGFDDRPSWIFFKTIQLTNLVLPGELENLPEEILPNSIALNKSSLGLMVGNTEQLIPALNPTDITDSTVTWRSTDPSIASVDTNGNISGVNPGMATIIATTSNNLVAQCFVEICKDFDGNVQYTCEYQDGFTVNSLTANRVGEKIIFTVDYYSNRDCDYSFFNPSNGDVIMKAVYGGIRSDSNTAEIALSLYEFKRMMVNPSITMRFGFDDQPSWIFFKTVQLANLVLPGELENLPEEVLPIAITLNKSSLDLMVGSTEQLIPVLDPTDVTDSTVTWRSTDPSIISVDTNGNIRGINPGTATIIVTSSNNLNAVCQIDVLTALLGDVDGNGSITAYDALMALQIATGKKTGNTEEIKAADVDNSGSAQAYDALRILQFATGKIKAF